MNDWLKRNLICPRDRLELRASSAGLVCPNSHSYPMIQGIPIMLLEDAIQTHGAASESLRWSASADGNDSLYLETLGCSDSERAEIRESAANAKASDVDPVVQYMIGATSGLLYKALLGKLKDYPIPELRLGPGNGQYLLDVGCNWGRWCTAAAKKGYKPVGIDPSLGAILAAERVSKQLGLEISYVVADGRHLPFREQAFDTVFSYSVLQHFSKRDAVMALKEVARVLKKGGAAHIQMANALGIRSLQHQIRRGFRVPAAFEVRYWTPSELQKTFTDAIGPTSQSVDGFFGLGIQRGDLQVMPRKSRIVIRASEVLRQASTRITYLKWIADSLYLHSELRPKRHRRYAGSVDRNSTI